MRKPWEHDDIPSGFIKHGLLENEKSKSVIFLARIARNLHSVQGFSSQPFLMTPEGIPIVSMGCLQENPSVTLWIKR